MTGPAEIAQLSLMSPLGDLTVTAEAGAIVALDWGRGPRAFQAEWPVLVAARDQLNGYFDGAADPFDIPLRPAGSAFAQTVWRALRAIPHGETRSYGEIARRIGGTPRAVGRACGANPIPIIQPCHRVLAAGGQLGGYSGAGGVETKAALLRLEGALL